jgi:putative flippase GtrA
MSDPPLHFSLSNAMSAHQSIFSRILWFGIGGGLSVAINASIFFLVRDRLLWPESAALAVSLVVVTTVFAIWNYRLNFRTNRGWRECLARYLAAVAFCFGLNYAIGLTGIKQLGGTKLRVLAVLFTVQVLVSGVKFLLYHHWVYPRASRRPQSVAMPGELL